MANRSYLGSITVGNTVANNTHQIEVSSSGSAVTSLGLYQGGVAEWALGMSSGSSLLRLTWNGLPGVGTDWMTVTTGGVLSLSNTTDASAIGTASVVLAGGLSVAKKLFIGDEFRYKHTGGSNYIVGPAVDFGSGSTITSISDGGTYLNLEVRTPGLYIYNPTTGGGSLTVYGASTFLSATTASSTSAAALVVTGGVGIGDNLRVANAITAGSLAHSTPGTAASIKVPDGFIIKTGSLGVSAQSSSAVTYPTAFPTSTDQIIISISTGGQTNGLACPQWGGASASGFTAYNNHSTGQTFVWIAIGH
ncbi:MAG: hypothetical protein JW395_1574 [Nitrospira sp.]|nr:hypothetical protein [Nitrospira sp.]